MKVLFSTDQIPPKIIYLPITPTEGRFFELDEKLYNIYRVVAFAHERPLTKDDIFGKIYCTEVVNKDIIEREDLSPMAANVLSKQDEENKVKRIDAPNRSEPTKRSQHITQLDLGL